MANFTSSPSMNLPIPTVGVDPGPDYATNLNACLTIVDSHTHAPGSGVQITPSAMNISSDLTFNLVNNAIGLRSVRFTSQASPLALASDLGCLYESGSDLYFNDGVGNQVRITSGGSVAGSSGTITGLPSGTASASFQSVSGTFQFQQATSTGANIDVASVAIRYPGSYPTPAGNYIQLQAPSSLATGYSITLPATTPGSNGAFLTESTSGVVSYTNVDNSTIEINSATLRVKASGIGTPQIADSAVSTPKIADGAVTPVKKSALGQQISNSCGSFSTASAFPTYVDVTNLSVTITTTGRPVFVGLIYDGNTSINGSLSNSSGGVALLRIERDATTIAMANIGINVAPCGFSTIDVVSSGTYTYKIQVATIGSGTVTVNYSKLIAYEL